MPELNLWLGFMNLLCAVVFGVMALPLRRGNVQRNEVFGFRLQVAMESDEAWDRYNRIFGRYLLIWSIVVGALGLICLWWPPLTGLWVWFFALAPCLVVLACPQTLRAARRSHPGKDHQ